MATSRSAIFDTPASPMCEHQGLPFTHCTFLGRHHLTFKNRMHRNPQSLSEGRFSFIWLQNSKRLINNHYLLVRIIFIYECFHSRRTRRSTNRGEYLIRMHPYRQRRIGTYDFVVPGLSQPLF